LLLLLPKNNRKDKRLDYFFQTGKKNEKKTEKINLDFSCFGTKGKKGERMSIRMK
jgi:hypothetical protein